MKEEPHGLCQVNEVLDYILNRMNHEEIEIK